MVLPGLDTDLDDGVLGPDCGRAMPAAARSTAPAIGHPQFAMQALLTRIGIARERGDGAGARAPYATRSSPKRCGRPPPPTAGRAARDAGFGARSNLRSPAWRVIEAANAEEEALAIAVALREAIETPASTAALVTPDRALARRVLAALGALERGGRRFRRRPARRHAGRACSRASPPRPRSSDLAPVDAAGAAQASAAAAWASAGTHARAHRQRSSARCCAVRARGRAPTGLLHALATFRTELDKLRARRDVGAAPSDPRADA